jgi:formate dehydrogenase major subunit
VPNPRKPEKETITTCAYCGVGCGFKAETIGDEIVRMTPWKDGKANHGHSCVKGRFAYDYWNHPDRVKTPMIRRSIDDPWQEVSWDEAFAYAAGEFKRIQETYGRKSVGGVSSSRCTNEEIFLTQKFVRAVMGNNNIDNCARICHSPTQFGMSATVGWGAASQHFDSILQSDVILVVGANPTEGHPVFGSMLKRRVRQGAKLIVIDPRRTETVDSPHCHADIHLSLRPGTNVAVLNSLAHVVVREGLCNREFIEARCEVEEFEQWAAFVASDDYSPETVGALAGLDPEQIREAARAYASGPRSAIYYGLGVTEHSQGSTGVMCLGNLALSCGMFGREGVGVNPLRGQGNVQGGSCLGSWPHVFSGYRFVTDDATRESFEAEWGVPLDGEPGLRLPNMFDAALTGHFKGMYIMGEDPVQSDPNQNHIIAAMRNMECVVLHDIFMNETSKYAHVLLPGSSSLEKDGTFTNAERRISRVRQVVKPLAGYQDWEITMKLMNAMGYPKTYDHAGEVLDELARLSPAYRGASFELIDRVGSAQWPVDQDAPHGTEVLHREKFPRANGKGTFMLTGFVPTRERTTDQYPLLLTTGRILSQYNVGTQTRRTANSQWHSEDVLEIARGDMDARGLKDGDLVLVASRFGSTRLRIRESLRVNPGVVYTTFHHAKSRANALTSDLSDWATNCPEYKVTAVEVSPVTPPQGRSSDEAGREAPGVGDRSRPEVAREVAEEVS